MTNLASGYQNLEMIGGDYSRTMVDFPPIEQPVITYDASTGERMLSVNEAYSVRIPQLQKAESSAVLQMLFGHVSKGEHCMRLQYSVGDVCIFDNHKLQYATSPHIRRNNVTASYKQ